ncbi:NERD domain-containing protein, partial [Streptomyces kaempferi]
MWRRLLALVGFQVVDARMESLAQRAEKGAAAERATGAKLRILESRGWYVLHGRHVPGCRADLDHVLVPPNGRAVVVLDTKRWHAQQATYLKGGKVHCGGEDRHDQIEAVAG